MATYYVNAATGNAGFDGLSEHVCDPVILNRGPLLTIQAAVAAASAGDVIRVANSTYTAPTGGIVIDKALRVIGESSGSTIVNPFAKAANEPVFKITVAGGATLSGVELHDMKLMNAVAAAAFVSGNYGVQCDIPASANSIIASLLLNNVHAVGMGDDGFHLVGGGASNCFFVFLDMWRCQSTSNYGYGTYINTSTGLTRIGCYENSNQKDGCRLDVCQFTDISCAYEDNTKDSGVSATLGAQLRVRSCISAVIINPDYEKFTTASQQSKRALVAENSAGLTHLGGYFANASESSATDQRAIYLTYGGGGALHSLVGPCRVSNTKTFIEVDSSDSNVDVYEPFKQAGTTPAITLPATMHRRSWT